VFKIPRIIVYVLMIGGCIAVIPALVFARLRATPSPNRPIHIFWDMDFQPKFKAQAPNPLFADGRAMRPPVQGSVARGESYVDTHMYEGVVDGQWATALPASMKLDQATLERGKRIVELFKQNQYNPLPVEQQAAILWAMQNNFLDDVAVEKVKDFQTKLMDFLATRKAAVLDKVRTEKAFSDALAGELKAAIVEFKQGYR
jgi:hypothetical protein